MQRNSGSKRERFSRLCPCLTSVHENGVWRNLEILAGRIRNVEDPVTRMVPPRYQAITDYPYEEEEYEYEYWSWRDNEPCTRGPRDPPDHGGGVGGVEDSPGHEGGRGAEVPGAGTLPLLLPPLS